MGREIKFRGKRLDNGEWVHGMLSCLLDDRAIISTNEYIPTKWMVDPKTVSQLTGLRDKNGREIYESDVVNVREIDSKTYRIGFIKWGESYPEWGVRSYVGKDFIGIRFPVDDIEVIGNIYDNKELLEAK